MRASLQTVVVCVTAGTLVAGSAWAQTSPPRRTPQQVMPTGEEDAVVQTPEDEQGRRLLEALTSESIAGLEFEERSDGTIGLDLQGRFQNVLTAAPAKGGGFSISCRHGAAGHALGSPLLKPWLPVRGRTAGRLDVKPLTAPILVISKAPVLEEK